jgi:hypothetical protein
MRRALSVVDEGGEIVVASSGNYDQFTIRKSVAVVAAPGVHAVITAATGSNAVTVNTSTTGVVALRGLTLNGLGGVTGISVVSVGILDVEDCILNGFTGNAVAFVPPFAASPGPSPEARPRLRIRDTTVKNSGSDFASAVYISTDGHAFIDRLRMDHNRHGLVVDSGRVTIRDSVAASQVVHAVWARALNNTVNLNIENCTIVGTQFGSGIVAGDSAGSRGVRMSVSNATVMNHLSGIVADQSPGTSTKVWVSNTTITLSGSAIFSLRGAAILSRGNNTLEGNNDNGGFTAGFSAK